MFPKWIFAFVWWCFGQLGAKGCCGMIFLFYKFGIVPVFACRGKPQNWKLVSQHAAPDKRTKPQYNQQNTGTPSYVCLSENTNQHTRYSTSLFQSY